MSQEDFVGQVVLFAFPIEPRGYRLCQGQSLDIGPNAALYSLIANKFGGNGTTNFLLPDLRGSAVVGMGQAKGRDNYDVGKTGGSDFITLLQSEMETHTHALRGVAEKGDQSIGTGFALADSVDATSAAVKAYSADAPSVAMSPNSIGLTGGSLPHNNMMPYLALNWCICVEGIFPTRP